MKIKDPARVLDEISREHVRQDIDLLPGVLAKIQTGNPKTMKTATKLRLAALLLALVLLITFFSLPGVVSALKKLLGYVPGVGAVDQSAPLRVLANPVTDARDGFTLTVESALLDSAHTVIRYRIRGAFPARDETSLGSDLCTESPTLRLGDGRELTYPAGEGGRGADESQWKDTFSALPGTENRATLVLPCLRDLPIGAGPQNWEIPLTFAPAPPELTVYPLVDLPTPTGVAEPASVAGIQLNLQNAAQLENGYYLQARLDWQNDPAFFDVVVYPDAVHLFDANGQEVPILDVQPAVSDGQSFPLNLQTERIHASGPARLVVDYVGVWLAASSSIAFDVGENPQPGQTWQLNKDLVINGHPLRVLSAEYIRESPEAPAILMLYLQAGSDVLFANFLDLQHEFASGGAGSSNSEDLPFRAAIYYQSDLPKGKLALEISAITVRRAGPWSVTWTPPDSGETGLPASLGTACVDENTLRAAPTTLPNELTGRLAFNRAAEKVGLAEMFVASLKDSEIQSIGNGISPALSPDGSQVAYIGADGLHLRNLSSQNDTLIPGTTRDDQSPLWSPDGSQIAFARLVGERKTNLYLVGADGANLRVILPNPEEQWLMGWTSDSGRILFYTGLAVRSFDLKTNTATDLFDLQQKGFPIAVSPDGRRLVYEATVDEYQALYLASLDNPTDKLLLARANPGIGSALWRWDGQWLAVVLLDAAGDLNPSLLLLQPDTCQVFTRPDLKGYFSSWVP